MKAFWIAAALALLAPAAHADPFAHEEVAKAERDFAAETKANGFARGFIAWSTPDAVGWQPEQMNFHQKLVDDLAADPSLATHPTKLRWKPFYIGVASSGDLAFDLGPWTIEGGDGAGWYFTIWQKQPDGRWLWVLDGGAGKDTPGNLPAGDDIIRSVSNTPDVYPNGLAEGLAQDDAFNATLKEKPAEEAFASLRGNQTTIASDGVAPYISGYVPWPETDDSPKPTPEQLAKRDAERPAALAARPPAGLNWQRDGQGASKSGSFVYTYGHATAADGSYIGHYVRVWKRLTPDPANWVLEVDVFQK